MIDKNGNYVKGKIFVTFHIRTFYNGQHINRVFKTYDEAENCLRKLWEQNGCPPPEQGAEKQFLPNGNESNLTEILRAFARK